MSENLKVNANSSVLEHKRKHNLLVDGLQNGNFAIDFTNLVDSQGHKRFIEGDITLETITGLTGIYAKWSLSGSHLLIVVSFSVENGITLDADTKICDIDLPKWVKEKIVAVAGSIVLRGTFVFYDSLGGVQNAVYTLRKGRETGNIFINSYDAKTLSSAKTIRIAYDLLIDNETSELQGE